MKSIFNPIEYKALNKSEILFYKLLPKWKNHKSWDFLRQVEYPVKKDVKPGPDYA